MGIPESSGSARIHNYLVIRDRNLERGRALEIIPAANEWHRSVILQSIGEFVISAMESIMNDVDLEDRDADVEIYLSALDESEHREMQAVIRDAGAVDRLLDDPRTYHS